MVDILLSIHDVLRSGGRTKWTFGRENRVRSALKLLAETAGAIANVGERG